jgi:hypothetical protein
MLFDNVVLIADPLNHGYGEKLSSGTYAAFTVEDVSNACVGNFFMEQGTHPFYDICRISAFIG